MVLGVGILLVFGIWVYHSVKDQRLSRLEEIDQSGIVRAVEKLEYLRDELLTSLEVASKLAGPFLKVTDPSEDDRMRLNRLSEGVLEAFPSITSFLYASANGEVAFGSGTPIDLSEVEGWLKTLESEPSESLVRISKSFAPDRDPSQRWRMWAIMPLPDDMGGRAGYLMAELAGLKLAEALKGHTGIYRVRGGIWESLEATGDDELNHLGFRSQVFGYSTGLQVSSVRQGGVLHTIGTVRLSEGRSAGDDSATDRLVILQERPNLYRDADLGLIAFLISLWVGVLLVLLVGAYRFIRYLDENRLRITREAEDERNIFRHLIDALPVPLFQVGTSGVYTLVNKKFKETFDCGESFERRLEVGNEERLRRLETLIGLSREGLSCDRFLELDGATPKGSLEVSNNVERHFQAFCRKISMQGTSNDQLVVVLSDVTDLRQARAMAEKANQAKSLFLATMSHEIRTPLNGILGMAHLIRESAANPDQVECIQTIKTSGEILLNLINDVLDYSKVEAGQMELEMVLFDPLETAEAVGSVFTPRAREKGLDFAIKVDGEVPKRILGDPIRVQQVLMNLVGNAFKFTKQGEILIRIIGEGIQKDGRGRLVIEVIDTGKGIAPDRIEAIFNRFSQESAKINREYGGTGLGLAISRQLVELMGGSLDAESEVGKGSVFRAIIPFAAAEPPQQPRWIPEFVMKRPKVSIRIRNWTVAEMVGSSLEQMGCVVDLAKIDEAIRDGFEPDVIFLGESLVAADGQELFGGRSGIGSPKIVRLASLPGDMKDDLTNEILVKPVTPRRIESAILNVLKINPEMGRDVADEEAGALPKPAEDFERRKVLIVDDNRINQRVIGLMLERMGYLVEKAGSGEEALELYSNEGFELIFMDIQMQGLDGMETARLFRDTEAKRGLNRSLIVALTANAQASDREAALESGMDDYLSKPIRIEALNRVLEHFEQWRSSRLAEEQRAVRENAVDRKEAESGNCGFA